VQRKVAVVEYAYVLPSLPQITLLRIRAPPERGAASLRQNCLPATAAQKRAAH
jgi:hypothetical protein